MKEFEILSLDIVKGSDDGGSWYKIKTKFTVKDPVFLERCRVESSDYKPVHAITDISKHKLYVDGLELDVNSQGRINFKNKNGIERDDVYLTAWEYNFNPLLEQKDENTFIFEGYFEKNFITKQCVKMLKKLYRNENDSRTSDWSVFELSLKTLDMWWD